MKKSTLCLLLGLVSCASHTSKNKEEVVTESVTYKTAKTSLVGHIARPINITKKLPGVLVVHEWYGLNDYAKMRAEMLAKMGYVAMAIDMYGEGKNSSHPKDAKEFMMESLKDPAEAKARFESALELLKQDSDVDPNQIAAIGYCFGGGVVLSMARAGIDLKGVASFHGSLGTEKAMKEGSGFKGKVFVATGGADPMVPPNQVAAFSEEMQKAKVDYRLYNYPNVLHAFTNPKATAVGKEYNLPLAYDAYADKASWSAFNLFLNEIFPQN